MSPDCILFDLEFRAESAVINPVQLIYSVKHILHSIDAIHLDSVQNLLSFLLIRSACINATIDLLFAPVLTSSQLQRIPETIVT
jgi:hypothetical protein